MPVRHYEIVTELDIIKSGMKVLLEVDTFLSSEIKSDSNSATLQIALIKQFSTTVMRTHSFIHSQITQLESLSSSPLLGFQSKTLLKKKHILSILSDKKGPFSLHTTVRRPGAVIIIIIIIISTFG